MTKINSTKDLPNWFSIENYAVFRKFDKKELKKQLDIRLELYTILLLNLEEEHTDSSSPFECNQEVWESIINNTVAVKNKIELSDDDKSFCNARISWLGGVRGIFAFEAHHFVERSTDKGLVIDDTNAEHIDYQREWLGGDMSGIEKRFDFPRVNEAVYLSVNLKNYSDAEILKSFEKLLPKWRRELQIPSPSIVFAKDSDDAKIIPYKLLPLLDLLIWSNSIGAKIPNRVLAIALFPTGEKGETEIKQTIMPLLNKLVSDNYRRLEK